MNELSNLEVFILIKTQRDKYRADILPKWAVLEKLYNCEIKKDKMK